MSAGKNLLFIDEKDAFINWGVTLKKGSLSEFLKMPERKVAYSHDFIDEAGTEYDPTEPFRPKTIDYTLVFNFTSGDLQKLFGFQEYIKSNRLLTFRLPALDNKVFKVTYFNSVNSNIIDIEGGFYCDMTFLFKNNFE